LKYLLNCKRELWSESFIWAGPNTFTFWFANFQIKLAPLIRFTTLVYSLKDISNFRYSNQKSITFFFILRSGQTKDYTIGICCFSTKHPALRRKSKDWLAWNQDNVSEWGDMSIRGLLFQWASTLKIQLSVLV
jgi:hypothetical protein